MSFQNWGRCWGSCKPSEVLCPTSVDEIRTLIQGANKSNKKLRIVGRGMAPSDMLFTDGAMLRTDKMNRVLHVDPEAMLVTFEAGATISDVAAALVPHELVLNTALSVKRCSMAAAALVAAHGTGYKATTLASAIVAVKGVTGSGELLMASEITGENKELLPALRCSLGLLMCVTEMTLRVEKRVEHVMESSHAKLDDVLARLGQRRATCSHYKFVLVPFTDHCFESWASPSPPSSLSSSSSPQTQQERKAIFDRRIADAHRCASDGNTSWTCRLAEFGFYAAHDSRALTSLVHRAFASVVLSGHSKAHGVDVMGINYLDVLFAHATLEWAVAARHCEALVREWDGIINSSDDLLVHLPLELRFTAYDDAERVWLSPSNKINSSGEGDDDDDDDGICYVGMVVFRPYGLETRSLQKTCARFQELMLKYNGRSHWSKPFEVTPQRLHAMYPKLAAFEALRRKMDPNDVLVNEWYTRKLRSDALIEQGLKFATPLLRSSL